MLNNVITKENNTWRAAGTVQGGPARTGRD